MRMSLKEFQDRFEVRDGKFVEKRNKKHKHNARPETVGGDRFDSQIEKKVDGALKIMLGAGEIIHYQRQVPLELPAKSELGNTRRYFVDFVVRLLDGKKIYIETKGQDLYAGKLKRDLVRSHHGIYVHVCRSVNDVLKVIRGEVSK